MVEYWEPESPGVVQAGKASAGGIYGGEGTVSVDNEYLSRKR